jgi:hypothetical protein
MLRRDRGTSFLSTLQQIGRMNRTPVTEIEIHVVSNRDRVAQEIFDLRFQEFVVRRSCIP